MKTKLKTLLYAALSAFACSALAAGPTQEDPRTMEQRYLCGEVFDKMLNDAKNLEGVDRDQLRTAIARGLKNQDGHARSKVSGIYQRLTFDEIKPLLPAIRDAVDKPAPSGEMFADEVRLNGLKLLAAHQIEEGIPACADYLRTQNPWASQDRTPKKFWSNSLSTARTHRLSFRSCAKWLSTSSGESRISPNH